VDLKTVLVAALVLFTNYAWTQMTPAPGSEIKKLDYFVGSWAVEGTIGQGPWGNGGKFSSSDRAEWMPGKFFVEIHSDFKMPAETGGDGMAIAFMGYDTDANLYTYDEFNSQGRREISKGIVRGDTWTWTSTQNYGGQEVKQKMTMKVLSPSSYSLKFEVSVDGTTWMTFLDTKATKK
jgi:hypothetical protein